MHSAVSSSRHKLEPCLVLSLPLLFFSPPQILPLANLPAKLFYTTEIEDGEGAGRGGAGCSFKAPILQP